MDWNNLLVIISLLSNPHIKASKKKDKEKKRKKYGMDQEKALTLRKEMGKRIKVSTISIIFRTAFPNSPKTYKLLKQS